MRLYKSRSPNAVWAAPVAPHPPRRANGVAPAALSRIMLASSGNNWVLQKYNPVPGVMEGAPASRGYAGGFAVEHMAKDLALAQSAAAGNDGGRAAGTRALVVVPTRELATQSHEVLQALCPPWLVTSCLTGGERKKSEKARLRKGVGVLVATPGRVADHLRSTAAFVVSACQLLVLDEADLLLELGFRPALDEIITALDERAAPGAPRRQSALLSATAHANEPQTIGFSVRRTH